MDLVIATEQRRLTAEAWQKHIEEREKSGKRVSDYCRENGLTTHKYYYWRKRLCGNDSHGGFVECSIRSVPAMSPLILECANGYRLHIGAGFDEKTCKQVLEVLAQC